LTLMEVLLVLSIIGIVMAIALPRIVAIRNALTLDAAAQEVVAQLNLSRSEAIRRNVAVSFVKISASQFRVGTLTQRDLPGGVTFGTSTPDSVRFASFGPPSTGAATLALQIGSRTRNVRVNAAGYASY